MKILSIEQVRQADAYTIKNEPIADIDLMERAANVIFKWIKKYISKKQKVKIFCGLGNNGGDGLVLARLLLGKGYKVETFIIRFSDKMSPSCKINYERLSNISRSKIINIKESDKLPLIKKNDLIIDAVFGSGLSKPV